MSKLIYVDRLKKDILALRDCDNGFSDTYDKACILGVIDEQPTIEERKTGEWIRHPEQKNIYGGKCVECSACGEKYVVQYIEDEKFCRNCGADMRGGNHETP